MSTIRSVIISFFLIIFLSIWTIYNEHFVGSLNSISPPPGAILIFFFVVLINSLIGSKKLKLRSPELILIYSLLLVAAPISSFAVTRFFISILLAPFYFATPENEFEPLFHNSIPSWFAPRDFNVVKGYYEPLDRGVPFYAWIKPLSVWIPVILAFYILMLCMSIIIQKQWIDRERLTFPTVQLPLRLAETPEQGSLFNSLMKNKFLWIGFAIPAILHGINGLSFYNPVIPKLPFKMEFTRFLTDSPWNAVDLLPINFYPNVIGFAYLLPVEISFSCWSFYLLSKIEMILGSVFGLRMTASSGRFPFADYQSAGAFIALMIVNLWFGRRYLLSIFAKIFGTRDLSSTKKHNEQDDAMTKLYRFALAGLIIASVFLIWWFVSVGVKPLVIIVFLLLFLIYSFSAGRVRTEAGLGAVSGPVRMDDLLRSVVGTKSMGVGSLTTLAYLRWITVDLRGFMSSVPAQLESFKMAGKSKDIKRLPILILSSVTLALLISIISHIFVSYRSGASTSLVSGWWMLDGPRETFEILRRNLLNLQGTDWTGVEFVLIGSAVTGIIAYLRTKFLWFPFHPIGYAVGFSRLSMDWIWFSVFVGWGLKLCVIKYGGLKMNRLVVPVCLGLILGDFFMAGFWSVIGSVAGNIVYQIFP